MDDGGEFVEHKGMLDCELQTYQKNRLGTGA
jgi:hypothetical protein